MLLNESKSPALTEKPNSNLIGRLLWFAGIWLLSVAALAVVAYAIRWAIIPVKG